MSKANIDQCAKILTDMFSAIPKESNHEKLRALVEECNMGNNEDYEETLKGLFQERSQNTTH